MTYSVRLIFRCSPTMADSAGGCAVEVEARKVEVGSTSEGSEAYYEVNNHFMLKVKSTKD